MASNPIFRIVQKQPRSASVQSFLRRKIVHMDDSIPPNKPSNLKPKYDNQIPLSSQPCKKIEAQKSKKHNDSREAQATFENTPKKTEMKKERKCKKGTENDIGKKKDQEQNEKEQMLIAHPKNVSLNKESKTGESLTPIGVSNETTAAKQVNKRKLNTPESSPTVANPSKKMNTEKSPLPQNDGQITPCPESPPSAAKQIEQQQTEKTENIDTTDTPISRGRSSIRKTTQGYRRRLTKDNSQSPATKRANTDKSIAGTATRLSPPATDQSAGKPAPDPGRGGASACRSPPLAGRHASSIDRVSMGPPPPSTVNKRHDEDCEKNSLQPNFRKETRGQNCATGSDGIGEISPSRTAAEKTSNQKPKKSPKSVPEPFLDVLITSVGDKSVTALGLAKKMLPEFKTRVCELLKIKESQIGEIRVLHKETKVLVRVKGAFETLQNNLSDRPLKLQIHNNTILEATLKHYPYLIKGIDTSSCLETLSHSVETHNNIKMLRPRFMGKPDTKTRANLYFECDSKIHAITLKYNYCALQGTWGGTTVVALHKFVAKPKENHETLTRTNKTAPFTEKETPSNTKPRFVQPTTDKHQGQHSIKSTLLDQEKEKTIPPNPIVPNERTLTNTSCSPLSKVAMKSKTEGLLPTPRRHHFSLPQKINIPPPPPEIRFIRAAEKDLFIMHLLQKIENQRIHISRLMVIPRNNTFQNNQHKIRI